MIRLKVIGFRYRQSNKIQNFAVIMDEAIFTFLPEQGTDRITLWIALGAVLIASAGVWALLKQRGSRETHNRRMLLAMLLFFAAIIAASTAFFTWQNMRRTGPFYIFADRIETSHGATPFSEIKKMHVELDQRRSLVNPGIVTGQTRLLVIEEKNGRVYVFSEENYDIDRILGSLKEVLDK